MNGYLRLSARERKTCLDVYRADRTVRRALVLLLLAQGRSYRRIRESAFVSPTLVASVTRDYQAGGCPLGAATTNRTLRPGPVVGPRGALAGRIHAPRLRLFPFAVVVRSVAMLLRQEHRIAFVPSP